jgi:signal transduction histidine kinase
VGAIAGGSPSAQGLGTVVVIDDNVDLCENLKEILDGRGYRTEVATTCPAGRRLAARLAPEVALIDLNLPDGSGLAVLKEVRAASPDTACVILTGNASLESAIAALDLGAYAYVVKGTSIPDFLAAVDRAAERSRLTREKRVLEAALGEARRFAEAVVKNAAVGILIAGHDGRILQMNPRLDSIVGRLAAVGDDVGALARALEARPEKTRVSAAAGAAPAAPSALAEVLRGAAIAPAGVAFEVRVEMAGAGGAVERVARTLEVFTSAIRDEAGALVATVAAVVDVTDDRRLRKKLIDAERLAAIGEVASRVAHEIRNPLAGISSAIQVMARDFEKGSKKAEIVRLVVQEVQRLDQFVEDLLLYARPIRPTRAPVQLREVVDRAVFLLRQGPLFEGIEVSVDDRLAGEPVAIDPGLFLLALENLLLNAAQAQKGVGRIRVELRPAVGTGEGRVLVAVEDAGPGIAPDALATLFEPFHSTKFKGTGLGLSTTKKIVDAHGGTISGQNLPGGGARFEIVV